MLAEFRTQLESRGLTVEDEAFAENLDFIKAKLHFEIDLALFGVEEARRNLTFSDPQAQFALTQFDEAERLLEVSQGGAVVAALR